MSLRYLDILGECVMRKLIFIELSMSAEWPFYRENDKIASAKKKLIKLIMIKKTLQRK